MRQFKLLGTALAAALLVAACGGGGGDGNQTPAVKFTSLVSFGDSLSDVGTYKVGAVAALGGGTYTVNGIGGAIGSEPTPTKNWIELVSAQLQLPAPCPAQTGLQGNAAVSPGFVVPVQSHSGCYAYAQGGSRVTNPIGAGNLATGNPLGQLTVPVVAQISNHLAAVGGKFSGTELVTVMAGGNDVFRLMQELSDNATAAGKTAFGNTLVGGLTQQVPGFTTQTGIDIGTALQTAAAAPGATTTAIVTAALTKAIQLGAPASLATPGDATLGAIVAAATTAATTAGNNYAATNGPANVAAMAQAGGELAAYVKSLIVAKGATHVVVVNLPDVSQTPSSKAQSMETQGLISNMVTYFNSQLQSGVAGVPGVIVVDAYADNRNQIANPASYALTNVTTPACNLDAPANGLADPTKPGSGTSLVCNTGNLKAGDVSHYLFADTVHPTPYGYKLLAQLVTKSLVLAGWL
jgi:outer membrane lipase/esterase